MIERCVRWAGQHSLPLIVLLYFPLALLYGLVTPIYEGPDEIGHVLYVKHIAEGRGIPVQSRGYAVAYGFGQEGSQPPLYYALNAGLVRALGLTFRDLDGLPPGNPFTTCGRPTGINVAGYRHDPRLEAFPYQGAARAVHVMRLFSALLGAGTVGAVYLAVRRVFPDEREVATLGAALVAFNPQFAFMGGVVNNDSLVNCLTAGAVALALADLRSGYSWRRSLALGAICGAAVLAKLGGLMAMAFAGLSLLLGLWRKPRALLAHGAWTGAGFLAVAGWWFVRNWRLYGDPTGTNVMLSIYGGRGGWPSHLVLPELLETFRSYWGAFACGLRYPAPLYWLFGLLAVLAMAGLAWRWGRTPRKRRAVLGLLAGWLVLVGVAWVRWNQITYAPLGRLWFQANAALATLFAYGLLRWLRRRYWMVPTVAAALWVVALAGALFVVRPAFALPQRYPVARTPAPSQALPEAVFGDRIAVPGYELRARSLQAGQVLDVVLFFQAMQPVHEDYALALQLVSPVPGDDTVLVNLNTIPGRGNYPTFAWRPDEVIVDRYRLPLPSAITRTQAWRVVAILYPVGGGERLPVSVAGQPAGSMLGLGLVRVAAAAPRDVPAEARLDPAPLMGEAIRLEGLAVERDGERMQVQAWWRAVSALASDYTALVHLYDADGNLLAAVDRPPLDGRFPTSLWQPGDIVEEPYVLPGEETGCWVGLGWYDPQSGTRLPVQIAGTRPPDDVYRVWLEEGCGE